MDYKNIFGAFDYLIADIELTPRQERVIDAFRGKNAAGDFEQAEIL